MMRANVRHMVTVSVLTAVMCLLAPLTLYIGPVPVSAATYVIYLYIYVFDYRISTGCVVVYLLAGMAGLPVFAGYTAGPGHLLSPTGGYIAGYIALSLISGILLELMQRCISHNILSFNQLCTDVVSGCILATGTVALYMTGTAWYVYITGNTVRQAMLVCVYPFLIWDAIKITAAVISGRLIKKHLIRANLL